MVGIYSSWTSGLYLDERQTGNGNPESRSLKRRVRGMGMMHCKMNYGGVGKKTSKIGKNLGINRENLDAALACVASICHACCEVSPIPPRRDAASSPGACHRARRYRAGYRRRLVDGFQVSLDIIPSSEVLFALGTVEVFLRGSLLGRGAGRRRRHSASLLCLKVRLDACPFLKPIIGRQWLYFRE